jgi:tRNA pseudouridine55 synthase
MEKNFNFENGEILLIDKELEWTSFDVVNKIRYSLKPIKTKVGHTGTLDPLATGLLIVCTGKLTKQISQFQTMIKVYSGTIKFGFTTPSYDLGTPINESFSIDHISKNDIFDAAKKFIGNIQQTPPIYSAIKQNGEPLYKKARRGEIVEPRKRFVDIYSFEITNINMPYVNFIISCGKGTYIRSIAYDIGKILNSGAHLVSLRRLKIGEFDVKNAIKINDFVLELKKHKE